MPVAWGYVPNAPSHVLKKPSVIPGFVGTGFSMTYFASSSSSRLPVS